MELPELRIANPEFHKRLESACVACGAAGAALLSLRGASLRGTAAGSQLKTAADRCAEALVYEYLTWCFPGDAFLCEERFEHGGFEGPGRSVFWTVDALDGTRSFVEGFKGFCVQVSYIAAGAVAVGCIHEPVPGVTYFAAAGAGAYAASATGDVRRLRVRAADSLPPHPVFVDSRYPQGCVRAIMEQYGGRFLECGSYGLKLCHVASGAAHVFAKQSPCKLWDLAPGSLIVREAGGWVGLWSGAEIPCDGSAIHFPNILAAARPLAERMLSGLAGSTQEQPQGGR